MDSDAVAYFKQNDYNLPFFMTFPFTSSPILKEKGISDKWNELLYALTLLHQL